jgi:hypothetical protein
MVAPHSDASASQFVIEAVGGYLYRLRNVGESAVHGVVVSIAEDDFTPGLPRNVTVLPMRSTETFFLRTDAGPPAQVVVRCDEHAAVHVPVPR